MKCEDVQKFIYIYLDGEMEEADRREVMVHITECPACTRTIALERATLRAVRTRTPRAAAPQWLRDRIQTRVGDSPVLLFLREIKSHPLAAAVAAAAFIVVLTVQHAGAIFGFDKGLPGGASPIATLFHDPIKAGLYPVFSAARANLVGTGYLSVNDRAQGWMVRRAAAPRPVYTGFDTLRLRPVEARPGFPFVKRGIHAPGGYLGAPRLNPYGVSYAMAGDMQAIDAADAVYFEAEDTAAP